MGEREGGEGLAVGLEEAGEATDVRIFEDIGQDAGADEAILEGVAGAGGRLGAVGEHPPAAVRPAAEVGGIDGQAGAALGQGADQRAQELAAPGIVNRQAARLPRTLALWNSAKLSISTARQPFSSRSFSQ